MFCHKVLKIPESIPTPVQNLDLACGTKTWNNKLVR